MHMHDDGVRPKKIAGTRGRSMVLAAALLVGVVLAAEGCGSSSSSSSTAASSSSASTAGAASAGVAAAKAAIQQNLGPVTWASSKPGPKFDASAANGKSVWVIDLNTSIPFNSIITDSIKTGLSAAGVKVTLCDGQGTPQGWNQCASQALAAHPAAIIDQSITPSLIGATLKKATAQGIHVVEGNIHDPSSRADLTNGAIGGVAYPFIQVGQLMADWAISDTNGKANVLVVTSSDVPNAKDLVDGGIKPELAQRCPSCKVQVVDVPVSDWATHMTSDVQSALTANPAINYILPIYDGMTTFVTPAITAAGAASRVKEASFNGTLAPMKDLVAGRSLAADVGVSVAWQGWQYADQTLRAIVGQPTVTQHTPLRVFDLSNSKDLPLTTEAQANGIWYGDVNFPAEFKRLWGVT